MTQDKAREAFELWWLHSGGEPPNNDPPLVRQEAYLAAERVWQAARADAIEECAAVCANSTLPPDSIGPLYVMGYNAARKYFAAAIRALRRGSR